MIVFHCKCMQMNSLGVVFLHFSVRCYCGLKMIPIVPFCFRQQWKLSKLKLIQCTENSECRNLGAKIKIDALFHWVALSWVEGVCVFLFVFVFVWESRGEAIYLRIWASEQAVGIFGSFGEPKRGISAIANVTDTYTYVSCCAALFVHKCFC